jgi:PKD repeat protein
MRKSAVALLLCILMLATTTAGCIQAFSSSSPPVPAMSITPTGSIRADMTVTFDASGSTDADGDILNYSWKFGDGAVADGVEVTHSYSKLGDYTVTLSVGDGQYEATMERVITIIDASAVEPHADIARNRDGDCVGEEPPSGSYILIWDCQTAENSDRSINPSVTAALDGNASWAGCDPSDSECYTEEYITSWAWDLDLYTDSDHDGDLENDNDAEGSSYEWKERPGGEWKIGLSVTADNGLTASETSMLYINHRTVWSDMEIDRNTSNAPEIEFNYPLTYEEDVKNTIRYVKLKLTYPRLDDAGDYLPGTPDSARANRLDLYAENATGEDVANTSAYTDDDRAFGDCDDDYRCVWLTLGSTKFREFLDGTYTVSIRNEKTHNTEITEFAIELIYK